MVFVFLVLQACGGAAPPSRDPSAGPTESASGGPAAGASAPRPCGASGDVRLHDLGSERSTEALLPCAAGGSGDLSGAIQIETIPEGVHIVIHATDDQVELGMLGSDVKTRDAVIVYPRGRGEKAVEVPLVKTKDGYTGDKIVMWDDLEKLNDEGTKLEVAVYDHDANGGEASEEMHVSVAVSTGKSCEKARDENPQTITMGASARSKPDLTDTQLGAPIKDSAWFSSCGLTGSAKMDVCVAVKEGHPLGVSVNVTPQNKRVAACVDRAARKIRFPASDKLDVVHESF